MAILFFDETLGRTVIAHSAPGTSAAATAKRLNLPKGWREISDEEAVELSKISDDERGKEVRYKRNKLIAETDYMMRSDYPISKEHKQLIIAYSKELRDITSQPGFPNDVTWPIKPEF